MKITIKDFDSLTAEISDFPKELKRAVRNAVNTAATEVKDLSVDEAATIYHIDKKSRILKDSSGQNLVFVKRAREGEGTATIEFKGSGGGVTGEGDRPGLQHFKVDRQERNKKKKGWKPSVQMKRGGRIEQIERGFYGVGKLKGQGIFQRQEGSRKIVRRTGPSIKQMVEDPRVSQTIGEQGEAILTKKLGAAVDYQLSKLHGAKR